ncbi:hypothetical protein KY359_03930 [Candidatus Woesearchaeota archaeon]|nr:hypothetical protein [Candidatus Woesearchaeota archaeon]
MPPKKKVKKAKKGKSSEEEAPVSREVKRRKDCPDCGSINIIFDPETEQLICQDCGAIFEELPPDMEKRYAEVDLL